MLMPPFKIDEFKVDLHFVAFIACLPEELRTTLRLSRREKQISQWSHAHSFRTIPFSPKFRGKMRKNAIIISRRMLVTKRMKYLHDPTATSGYTKPENCKAGSNPVGRYVNDTEAQTKVNCESLTTLILL